MWVKPSLLQEGVFWSNLGGGTENSIFFNGTHIYAKHYNSVSGNVYAGALIPVNVNKWYFIVCFFDETNEVCGSSVNGSGYSEVSKTGIKTADGSSNLHIGGWFSASYSRSMLGLYQDVMVFNRKLTSSEISELYGKRKIIFFYPNQRGISFSSIPG